MYMLLYTCTYHIYIYIHRMYMCVCTFVYIRVYFCILYEKKYAYTMPVYILDIPWPLSDCLRMIGDVFFREIHEMGMGYQCVDNTIGDLVGIGRGYHGTCVKQLNIIVCVYVPYVYACDCMCIYTYICIYIYIHIYVHILHYVRIL